MRLALIHAVLPPIVDGIGDYTAQLATELARGCHVESVVIFTGDKAAAGANAIPGVRVQGAFDPDNPATMGRLLDAITVERPDWVVLQYNPFSYGHWGLNLHLPAAMARIRRRSPTTRFAVMFHEMYAPVSHWKFAILTTWQRYQFWRLAREAEVLMFSIHTWTEEKRRRFPRKQLHHLPVGSGVALLGLSPAEARARLGIATDEVVLGVFGTAHVSRLFNMVNGAARAVLAAGMRVRVLYVGSGGAVARAAIDADIPMIADGPLPSDEVSRRLSAMDIALSTYIDGVSTRRSAMMATIQHGAAVVGTSGASTDPELLAENDRGLLLVPVGDDVGFNTAVVRLARDPAERARIAAGGLAMFERRYAWPAVARKLISYLAG